MPPFDYHRPDTVEEAVALLATYGGDGKVLAGGQSLLPVLALRLTISGISSTSAGCKACSRSRWMTTAPSRSERQ
jgi:hypothetical protein